MPNVNPPVDAGRAVADPDWVLRRPDAGTDVVVYIGREGVSDVLPEPAAWRYAVVNIGGRRFGGYLWHEGTATA